MLCVAALALLPFQQPDWQTHYEKSGFVETGRYSEAVDYCKRLAVASRDAKVIKYGKSPEGREMIALVISSEHSFSAKDAAISKKPLIFVQNGIHSGEIEGKDASLMLARDLLIEHKFPEILKGVNLIIVPVFSVDAHERFSPFNRINQNGPKDMGWRATAQNLNLNRDYMKADGGEMKNQLRLLHDWKPDFFFDNHTTDGADYQYTITLDLPFAQTQDPALAIWSRQTYDEVRDKLDAKGYLTAPYLELRDAGDPSKGFAVDDYPPRYSNGYLAAMNRASMLVETHMLKPYKDRVDSTYWAMVFTMQRCARSGGDLRAMGKNADLAESNKPAEGKSVVLASEVTEEKRPFTFKAWEYKPYESSISGVKVNAWDTSKPIDVPSFVQDQYKPSVTVTLPAAYAVPPQWKDVQNLLALHGIKGFPIKVTTATNFSTFKFADVKFGGSPFESRFMPQCTAVPIEEERTLMPGTMIYPTQQVGQKLLAQLLEPTGPDSLLRWGFFNVMFEGKEYFEDYSMEPIAKKMYDSDPKLRAEFDEKMKDEKFAKNSRARLQFFYERSPYYDKWLNKYPVVRLTAAQLKMFQSTEVALP